MTDPLLKETIITACRATLADLPHGTTIEDAVFHDAFVARLRGIAADRSIPEPEVTAAWREILGGTRETFRELATKLRRSQAVAHEIHGYLMTDGIRHLAGTASPAPLHAGIVGILRRNFIGKSEWQKVLDDAAALLELARTHLEPHIHAALADLLNEVRRRW